MVSFGLECGEDEGGTGLAICIDGDIGSVSWADDVVVVVEVMVGNGGRVTGSGAVLAALGFMISATLRTPSWVASARICCTCSFSSCFSFFFFSRDA